MAFKTKEVLSLTKDNKAKNIIAKNLKRLRHEFNLTQRQLADKLGVEQQSVYLWESGKRDVSSKYLSMMSEIFGLPLSYFIYSPEEDEEGHEELPQNLVVLLRSTSKLSPQAKNQIANFIRFVNTQEMGGDNYWQNKADNHENEK